MLHVPLTPSLRRLLKPARSSITAPDKHILPLEILVRDQLQENVYFTSGDTTNFYDVVWLYLPVYTVHVHVIYSVFIDNRS